MSLNNPHKDCTANNNNLSPERAQLNAIAEEQISVSSSQQPKQKAYKFH
jgi:hypothetical protein